MLLHKSNVSLKSYLQAKYERYKHTATIYYTIIFYFSVESVPSTATVAPVSGSFSCDFEEGSVDSLGCGIVQLTNDQFDWTRQTGGTPSNPTGPDGAYSGQYYVFIEASGKTPNDAAM